MVQPKGFIERDSEDKVCLLKKSSYDLKQSPTQQYLKSDKFMISNRFYRSQYDSCVYYRILVIDGGIYLLIYVDDMINTCKQKKEIEKLKRSLK